jgi:hypothetical protein
MKFFIPHAKDAAEAESVLSNIAKFVNTTVPPIGQRIFKLRYTHNGQEMIAEVGKPANSYYREGEQEVIAIIGEDPIMVCLPNRGVIRGGPILVGKDSVIERVFFEAG